MKASAGDHLGVHSTYVDGHVRRGEILEVTWTTALCLRWTDDVAPETPGARTLDRDDQHLENRLNVATRQTPARGSSSW